MGHKSANSRRIGFQRADAALPLMGMISYKKKSNPSIRKADVSIAKII